MIYTQSAVKPHLKRIIIWALVFLLINTACSAQTSRQAKENEVKGIIEAGSYVFKAQYANPMRGGNIYLTADYSLFVNKDSVVAYLPYYGQAYIAPMDATDAGIMFTTKHFDNKATIRKGIWNISIITKEAKDITDLHLNVMKDGSATLRLTSNTRDPISFQGRIISIGDKQ